MADANLAPPSTPAPFARLARRRRPGSTLSYEPRGEPPDGRWSGRKRDQEPPPLRQPAGPAAADSLCASSRRFGPPAAEPHGSRSQPRVWHLLRAETRRRTEWRPAPGHGATRSATSPLPPRSAHRRTPVATRGPEPRGPAAPAAPERPASPAAKAASSDRRSHADRPLGGCRGGHRARRPRRLRSVRRSRPSPLRRLHRPRRPRSSPDA